MSATVTACPVDAPIPLSAPIAAVVRLNQATICRALRDACAHTRPDALAEAIDQFLADLDDAGVSLDVTKPFGPGCIEIATDTLAAAESEAEREAGDEPYVSDDPYDANWCAWGRWDASLTDAQAFHVAEWRRTMARMLAAVEGVLAGGVA